MKIQVLHDESGRIHGFLAHGSTRRGILRSDRPDRMISDVDVPELDLDLSPENHERAAETLATLLGESQVVGDRLVRKSQ